MLDSVQWIRRGWQHRARVLSHPGAPAEFQWLTLPVKGAGHRERPLRELRLNPGSQWTRRLWKALESVYGNVPLFRDRFEPLIRPWFESEAPRFRYFADAALSSTRLVLGRIGYDPEIRFSSELSAEGEKTRLLVSFCRAIGATTNYTGVGTNYLESQPFREAGIELIRQRWKHPFYEQRAGRPFRSHLSVLDALAFVPAGEIREWLEVKPWGPFGEWVSV